MRSCGRGLIKGVSGESPETPCFFVGRAGIGPATNGMNYPAASCGELTLMRLKVHLSDEQYQIVRVSLLAICLQRLSESYLTLLYVASPWTPFLMKHCPYCQDHDDCRNQAEKKDHLSLLPGVSTLKLIKKYGKKEYFQLIKYLIYIDRKTKK